MKSSQGFTLAEILVSTLLLAIALLGVMGSIAYGTKHARSGEELAEATYIARALMSTLQEGSWIDVLSVEDGWPGPDSGINDEPGEYRAIDEEPFGAVESGGSTPQVGVFQSEQAARYWRRITVERVSDNPLNHRYRLARATVEVMWDGKTGTRSVTLVGLISHAVP